ncbi:MAG: hypothetical protein HRU05_17280 [Oceanospirillaceae bacterium]|nr:hypothetical protein [Oceanospirillaceae bacterium]
MQEYDKHKSLLAKSPCNNPAIRQLYAFFLKQVLIMPEKSQISFINQPSQETIKK